MSVLETLAILNPRSVDPRAIPTGGQPLTAHDLSHALGFIRSPGPRLLARYQYADQESVRMELEKSLARELPEHPERPRLARLAVQVYCRRGRCPRCRGVGERTRGARRIVCPRCHGSTWERIESQDLARALGINQASFREVERIFSVAVGTLADWDGLVARVLQKVLRN